MSFKLPSRPKDRKAVARILTLGPLGTLIIAALLVSSILSLPPDIFGSFGGSFDLALTRWGIDVTHLLLVMPIGATIVLFSRLVVGIDTFGIFTPMLIALAFIQIGPLTGPLLMGGAILAGALLMPLLERFDISRMGMMAVLIGVMSLALYLAQSQIGGAVIVAAFPVVVSALVVERWWITREVDGPLEAAWLSFATLALAIVIEFVLVAPFLKLAVREAPVLVPVMGIIAALLIARYRGLRMTELWRFEPLFRDEDNSSHEEAYDGRARD